MWWPIISYFINLFFINEILKIFYYLHNSKSEKEKDPVGKPSKKDEKAPKKDEKSTKKEEKGSKKDGKDGKDGKDRKDMHTVQLSNEQR